MRSAVFVTLVVICVAAAARGQSAPAEVGHWRELPLPNIPRLNRPEEPPRSEGISQIAVDRDGTLWMLASGRVYYWTGTEFREPEDLVLEGERYVRGLFGGFDRELLAARVTAASTGAIYVLRGSKAEYLTEAYFEGHDAPAIHLSKNGQLINWGKRFIAVLDWKTREWKREEIKLARPLFFEFPDATYVYDTERLLRIGETITSSVLATGLRTIENGPHFTGVAWGNDRIIFGRTHDPLVFAYHVNTLQPVKLDPQIAEKTTGRLNRIFRRDDGSIWIIKALNNTEHRFYRLAMDGSFTEARELRVGISTNHSPPPPARVILDAPDGSLWLAREELGLAQLKDGRVRLFGWSEGLLGRYHSVVGDKQGGLFAAGQGKVLAYQTGLAQTPKPASGQTWEQVPLKSLSVSFSDHDANIWCTTQDHPGGLSKWNGERWTHVDLSVGPMPLRYMLDDQGHILLPNVYDPQRPALDLGPDGVKKFERNKDMLVAALARGVRKIDGDPSSAGCVVDGKKIWFFEKPGMAIDHYDGQHWEQVNFRDSLQDLYYSSSFGVVFGAPQRFYTYEKGDFRQIGEIDPRALGGTPLRFLLGPKGFRLYDEALLKLQENRHAVVVHDGNKLYFAKAEKAATAPAQSGFTLKRTDPLPEFPLRGLLPSRHGGSWAFGGGQLFRIFAGRLIPCNLRGTPLEGRESGIGGVLEDRRGNLWIPTHNVLFMNKLEDFVLKGPEFIETRKRRLKVPITQPGDAPAGRLFWRLANEDWREADADGSVNLSFEKSGVYSVEVTAMNALGGLTPRPYRLTVEAQLVFPDTVVAAKPPYMVDDIMWELPVRALTSDLDAQAELVYRTEGSEWRTLDRGKYLPMGEFSRGGGTVEIAARESDQIDPTPLRLDFTYQPDYDRMVERRSESLGSDDPVIAARALAEVKMAGPSIVPALRRQVERARAAARRAIVLQNIVRDLEKKPGSAPVLEEAPN